MIKHYTRVSLCVACAALTLQLSAEVKWTYSGTALTEILPEGSDGTAWAFTLSSTGVLKGKTAGSGAVLDLRNETLPANAPRIVGTIPALVYKGSKTCTEVHLPEGVTAFAVNAFSGWSALTTIVVPSGVKTISSGCFNGCTSLTSVTLPEGIETIGDSAFYGCTAIVNIQLPSTLRTVGTGAFRGCSSLERIEPFFPDGVTSFGDSCLRECPKLEGELRIGYATNDGVMVSTTLAGNGYYLRGSTKVRTMRIGPGVSSLPTYTFDVQSNLAMIELGQNISRTGAAFPRDGGLTNLIVRHAGDFILDGQTFNGMTGLREITWGGWFTYTLNNSVFNKWKNLQCRFIVPRTNDSWNAFMADTTKMKPWADCSETDKTTYFDRYGSQALTPAGVSEAVSGGLPRTYIVKTLEGGSDVRLIAKVSNTDMASISLDPLPTTKPDLYAANTLVTVTVSVLPGATFVGWDGDVSEDDRTKTTIKVTMSKSKSLLAKVVVQPEIAAGSPVVAFPNGDSQPCVSFALTGVSGAYYEATADVLWRTNGVDWSVVRSFQQQTNGQSVVTWFPFPLLTGSTLDVRLKVNAQLAEERTADAMDIMVTHPFPPSFGKGGGATVCHVRYGATGDGTGSDWFNARLSFPKTSSELTSAQREIWVADSVPKGVGLGASNLSGPCTIRGGFRGTESAPSERPEKSVTEVDGEGNARYCLDLTYSGTIRLERFEFTRAARRGLNCSVDKNTQLELADCRITANGLGWDSGLADGGRAMHMTGTRADVNNSLWVSNCYFGGNVATMASEGYCGKSAVWLEALKHADFYDCTFETNGIAWWHPIGADATVKYSCGGSALRIERGSTSLTRCVFRANRNGSMNDNASFASCCVELSNGQSYVPWTCGVTNCLFIGNADTRGSVNETSYSGALLISDKAHVATADVVNCTFAYNIANTSHGSAGLTVHDGNVRVRNSIFYGNRQQTGNCKGCDLKLIGSTSSAEIDYTLFGAIAASNICNSASIVPTLGEHMQYGDPKFVTTLAEFEALLTDVVVSGTHLPAFIPDGETVAKVLAFDAHVRTCRSKAVDTGDPDAEYVNEPKPNGRRVNMGYYGNTSEAARSPGGTVLFVK